MCTPSSAREAEEEDQEQMRLAAAAAAAAAEAEVEAEAEAEARVAAEAFLQVTRERVVAMNNRSKNLIRSAFF